jgi:carbamoyl-phosphate synthase large subunit
LSSAKIRVDKYLRNEVTSGLGHVIFGKSGSMRKEAVLVTAAGSIVGEGIIKCLKLANTIPGQPFSYLVIAADMRVDAAGLYRGHFGEIIPSPLDESKYFEALVNLCRKYSIRAIFSGSDEELVPLAILAPRFEKELGVKVIVNPLSVLKIVMDKWKTFVSLKSEGLSCAESCLPENRKEFVEKFGYPLIVKPRIGHGSDGLFLVRNEEETDLAILNIRKIQGEPVIQEYLSGEDTEFTTGVTVSEKTAEVLSSISMRRKLKHGQTYKAFVENLESVRRSSEKVALALGGKGPVNVQSRVVDGISKVFEINPRFSASCPIRAAAGVNEPDIVFRDQVLKEDVHPPDCKKLVALRYWSEVYIPQSAFEKVVATGHVNVGESFVQDYF